jgi:anti-anti-sigma regulatory factor
VSVDLSGVAFTDSTGLSPLFGSALRRAATGSPVITVTALSHSVRRVLDLLSDLPEVQLLTRVGMAR